MGIFLGGKIIIVLIILTLAVIGVLIKYLKCYFLIAGYNAMSSERKKNMDLEGLGNFLGNFSLVTSGILFIGNVLESLGIRYALEVSLLSLLFIIPIILIKAQKFDHNNYTDAGKMKPQMKLFVTFILLVPAIMIVTLVYSSIQPRITVNDKYIEIDGMYGTTIDVGEITNVILRASIPDIKRKINGFNAGRIMRGNFELDSLGRGNIYIYKGDGPYIYIYKGEEFIIFNYKNSIKTEKLYEKVLSAWDR